jgi:predicted Zn-dependent protease
MKKKITIFSIFLIVFTLLASGFDIIPINKSEKINNKTEVIKKQRADVIYDFSCLENIDDVGSNKVIYNFGEITRNIQSSVLKDVPITVQDEKKAGDELLSEYQNKYSFITSGYEYNNIKSIMNDLVSRLAKPRGIKYEIHYVNDTAINALTAGGHIFFFKGIYKMCKSNSEIAAVIGHEIAHNELGHLTLALKKQKASSEFGPLSDIFLHIENTLTVSFNQKQEVEADFFGIDIVYPTSYNTCEAINLWNRMSNKDSDFNITDNFFRSHPYSKNRAICIQNHLDKNYNHRCNN